MRISVDLGFGYAKVVSESGKHESFPSVALRKTSSDKVKGFGLLGVEKDDYSIVMWNTGKPEESSSYYIGDLAMTSGGIRTWEEKVVRNINTIPIIMTACAIVGNGDIDLSVGLPMTLEEEEFEEQKSEIKELLKNKDFTLNIINYGTKKIKIRSVFVFQQGTGAYYAACLNINGEIKDLKLLNSPCGLIDPGQKTTDYLVMAKGKKGIAPRRDLSGGLDNMGMNVVYEQVKSYASKQAGKEVDMFKIEQAILWNDCKFVFRGKEINLSSAYEEACKLLANQIASTIKAKWGNEIDYLSKILIAGGGGEVLFNYLKEHFPNAEKMSTYSNAEGYLAFQALIMKNRRTR